MPLATIRRDTRGGNGGLDECGKWLSMARMAAAVVRVTHMAADVAAAAFMATMRADLDALLLLLACRAHTRGQDKQG